MTQVTDVTAIGPPPDRRSAPRVPIATYRLQFNAQFTFTRAAAIVDYLKGLGISDCYASSYLRAVPGSNHGYDVADPTQLNPEIGTVEEFWSWVRMLQRHGMGHILDVVPNHMGIAKSANAWWTDVLENGQGSRYARFFDIEWRPVKDELADKVLIPILGDYYGATLEKQELALMYREGAFVVRYYDDWLPIAADTYPLILEVVLAEWAISEEDAKDELRSVITAAANLPPRTSRDRDAVLERAREKEIIKRRLAALVAQDTGLEVALARALEIFNGIVGEPRSFDRLDALLNEQSYRLSDWHVASEEINYRRFFDVNQLAALRVEDPEVFDEVHRFIFDLLAQGAPTGFRIDHVDGLFAPGDYLRRLQARAAIVAGVPDASNRAVYVVVEKILGADEQLPHDWPVHGTTGYEFAAVVNNLFVDRQNERALDDIYARFVGAGRSRPSFDDLSCHSKKLVVHATMSGDINWLGHQLNRLSERNRQYRDFTLYSLIASLKELIACFPVYRTYITADDPPSEHDRHFVARAVRCAKERAAGSTSRVFDFIHRVLLKQTVAATPEECEERARFIGKFQQITSPVAAKGIEDTSLYLFNRLLSLNEVGADPTRFGLDAAAVHTWMAERSQRWPLSLSATSTHDTKRGEDVRARLNVLSELPGPWKAAVTRWRALNRRFRSEVDGVIAPDPNDEYLLYQTLVGAWPSDASLVPEFAGRVKAYMRKAMREAKAHTSWLNPNEEYESAVLRFVDGVLDERRPFLEAFAPFQSRIAELGIYNSLAQLLIKITAPGVPDFYQGTELWDLTLVDPDNRRPIDYAALRNVFQGLESADPSELLARRADGRVKTLLMVRALRQRAALRETFEAGSYVAMSTWGEYRDHLFAFARRHREATTITCVPRLVAGLVGDRATPPLGAETWGDTRLRLSEMPDQEWPWPTRFRDAVTGTTHTTRTDADGTWLDAAVLFERFPAALLVPVR